jgi:hypothetical protein
MYQIKASGNLRCVPSGSGEGVLALEHTAAREGADDGILLMNMRADLDYGPQTLGVLLPRHVTFLARNVVAAPHPGVFCWGINRAIVVLSPRRSWSRKYDFPAPPSLRGRPRSSSPDIERQSGNVQPTVFRPMSGLLQRDHLSCRCRARATKDTDVKCGLSSSTHHWTARSGLQRDSCRSSTASAESRKTLVMLFRCCTFASAVLAERFLNVSVRLRRLLD